MMRHNSSTSVRCPACHGSGTDVWERACKTCGSTGRTSPLEAGAWKTKRNAEAAEWGAAQRDLFPNL